MCGITGIYALNNSEVNKHLLLRMNNKIRHRGPDDEGYYNGVITGKRISLGMRRLSIIDIAGAICPPVPPPDNMNL